MRIDSPQEVPQGLMMGWKVGIPFDVFYNLAVDEYAAHSLLISLSRVRSVRGHRLD